MTTARGAPSDGSPPSKQLRRTPPQPAPPGAVPSASPTPSAVLGLRGLNNLGNTCFMNCVLQAWLHCPPVTRYFLADNHNRFACATQHGGGAGGGAAARTGGTPPPAGSEGVAGRRMCLACEMDLLCSQCFSGKHAPFSPHSFLRAMWSHSEYFAGYDQQDAHEFMIAALSGIYAGLAPPRELSASGSPNALATGGRASSSSSGDGDGLLSSSWSELQRIFTGVLRSDVTCLKCQHTSTKFEAFQDISLDLSKGPQAAGGDGGFHESLDACLRSFTRSERLAHTERCWCPTCGELQDSSKQLSVHRLPNVLCFHLKRFKRAVGTNGKATSSVKIDSMVSFPLHTLNMRPHTSAHIDAQTKRAGGAQPPFAPVEPLATELYDLFGVAAHTGGMTNGHYTSYVRSQADWYHCDDAMVTLASAEAVRACKQAYMLFYVQKRLS